jgi:hypothetical protein
LSQLPDPLAPHRDGIWEHSAGKTESEIHFVTP